MVKKDDRVSEEVKALRRAVMSKIDRLSGARVSMGIEELKELDRQLAAALLVTEERCRDELERFGNIVLLCSGRHPLEEYQEENDGPLSANRVLTATQAVSLVYRIRPAVQEILQTIEIVRTEVE